MGKYIKLDFKYLIPAVKVVKDGKNEWISIPVSHGWKYICVLEICLLETSLNIFDWYECPITAKLQI